MMPEQEVAAVLQRPQRSRRQCIGQPGPDRKRVDAVVLGMHHERRRGDRRQPVVNGRIDRRPSLASPARRAVTGWKPSIVASRKPRSPGSSAARRSGGASKIRPSAPRPSRCISQYGRSETNSAR
jgi:hypothetical protein